MFWKHLVFMMSGGMVFGVMDIFLLKLLISNEMIDPNGYWFGGLSGIIFAGFGLIIGSRLFYKINTQREQLTKEDISQRYMVLGRVLDFQTGKDLQRKYNYQQSLRIELITLAPKVPFIKKTNGMGNVENAKVFDDE